MQLGAKSWASAWRQSPNSNSNGAHGSKPSTSLPSGRTQEPGDGPIRLPGLPPTSMASEPGSFGPSFIDTELPKLCRQVASNTRFTRSELTTLRGQLLTLSQQELQRTERALASVLPSDRTEALRKAGVVMKGPASVDRLVQMVGGPGQTGRLPDELKETLRSARQQNLFALVERSGLGIVNGNQGLFRRINPGSSTHPEGVPIHSGGRSMDSIDQRYALLGLVARLLQVGLTEAEVEELLVPPDAASSPDAAEVSRRFEQVMAQGEAEASQRENQYAHLSCRFSASPEVLGTLATRLSQVRLLERAVADSLGPTLPQRSYRLDLQSLFQADHPSTAAEVLDARTERAMDLLIQQQQGAGPVAHIETVQVQRWAPDGPVPPSSASGERLKPDHPIRQDLAELRQRLDRGERSAVGVEYATHTFPPEILEAAARGDLTVIGFDGSVDGGLNFIRDQFGTREDGKRMGARVMGLQGLYGSYPRNLVTLDDGQQFLLLTGHGESRQLNNVGTVLLYANEQGQRLPENRLILATEGISRVDRFRDDILKSLKANEDPTLSNRLMILQNPQHLSQLLGDSIEWMPAPAETMVPLRVAIRTHDDGSREQILVPKVGGGGLYGDTTGEFLRAYFSSDLPNVSKDVIFNGTAGGFARTQGTPAFASEQRKGLEDVEPGGLIMPLHEVGEHGGPTQSIPSILPPNPEAWPTPLKEKMDSVHVTGRHVAVRAPAIETFPLVHDLVEHGYASVDVEAASLVRAAHALGVRVNMVYTHSDDPRSSEDHPNSSLGQVGPFLEGSRYHRPLFEFIEALWQHSRQAPG